MMEEGPQLDVQTQCLSRGGVLKQNKVYTTGKHIKLRKERDVGKRCLTSTHRGHDAQLNRGL